MANFVSDVLSELVENVLSTRFIEALNPLYLLPILAVAGCAFLVYAFGFKSPVLPPHFEEIEPEKKIHKKKKVKDNQKNKQSNVKPSGSSKPVEVVGDKKKKAEKPIKNVPRLPNKAVKKVTAPVEKKQLITIQELDPTSDEGNDEGWVHLVSKKSKKNRKRDVIATFIDNTKQASSGGSVESLDEISGTHEFIHEIADSDEIKELNENEVKKEVNEPVTKPTGKKALKKQKNKKKGNDNSEGQDNTCDIPASTQKPETNLFQNASNTTEMAVATKASKDKKSSKKKKKKIDHHEAEESSPSPSGQEEANAGMANKSDEAGLLLDRSDKPFNVKVVKDDDTTIENKKLITEIGAEKNLGSTDTQTDAKGSNVKFDELEGLYPSKLTTSKKKKKARRDH